MAYLNKENSEEKYEYLLNNGDIEYPDVTLIDENRDVKYFTGIRSIPLTFYAIEDCTFRFYSENVLNKSDFEYLSWSLDNGKTWETFINDGVTEFDFEIKVENESTIQLKGVCPIACRGMHRTEQTSNRQIVHSLKFTTNGNHFNAYGNPASILYDSDYLKYSEFDLIGFFTDTSITSGAGLYLPKGTYAELFYKCTELKYPPRLPNMNLPDRAYQRMFYGCTCLKEAPKLPATILSNYCYDSMFQGCENLEVAPYLPAETLTSGCYVNMFRNCSKLRFIHANFITIPTSTSYIMYDGSYEVYNATDFWVNGVSESGIYIKNDNAQYGIISVSNAGTSWSTSYPAIPKDWNIYTETEYNNPTDDSTQDNSYSYGYGVGEFEVVDGIGGYEVI